MQKILFAVKKKLLLVSSLIILSSFVIAATSMRPVKYINFQEWEKLGERKVNFKLDRDEIIVGGIEGSFNALKIKVRRGAINMYKCIVHFRNGSTKEVELRNNIPAGEESRVTDLRGNNVSSIK